jgi:peptide/nickel transport system substrate-binding protein
MMPARIASTSADEQVEYLRNDDYIPREEPPNGSAGGKKVYLDKVVWRYIADPWDASEDLVAGEVDWWQEPPLDFIPKIEQNPDLQTFLIDPLWQQGWLRPNFLHPPFNDRKAREALLHAMDQEAFLYLSVGQAKYYRTCNSVYACGGPYATTVGAEPMMQHNLMKATQLVKESAYDGTPIVVLQVIDRPHLNAAAIVTRQRLEAVGFKVILKAVDWSTNLTVRTRKEPPDKGAGTCSSPGFMAATSSVQPSTSGYRGQARTPGLAGLTSRSWRSSAATGFARPIK